MVKIDVSFNGHEPNCVCPKCCEAREFAVLLRESKPGKKDES